MAATIVRTLMDAVPSGSCLAISHATGYFDPERTASASASYRNSGVPFRLRTAAGVERLFAGVDLLDPGIVPTHRWRPDGHSSETMTDADMSGLAGVARTP